MKPKQANTLQQKLGFFDDDLKKPQHDDLMIWLNNNIERIINELYVPVPNYELDNLINETIRIINKTIRAREKVIKSCSDRITRYESKTNLNDNSIRLGNLGNKEKENPDIIQDLQKEIESENRKIEYLKKWVSFDKIPIRPAIKLINKVWELPITTHSNNSYDTKSSKFTVGFVDMALDFEVQEYSIEGFTDNHNIYLNEYLSDIAKKPFLKPRTCKKSFFIEVKTEIKSLGELIRQIQHYREYRPSAEYFVVCPDSSHKEILSEQNIGFIECQHS